MPGLLITIVRLAHDVIPLSIKQAVKLLAEVVVFVEQA